MRQALFIFLALVILASCKKTEQAKTLQDTLRGGKWKQSAGKVHEKGYMLDTTVNYFVDTNLYAKCMLDDYLEFKSNFDGAVNSGGNKCNPEEPDAKTFTWEMLNNGKNINIYSAEDYFSTSNVNAQINSLSDNSLSITYVVYFVPVPGTVDTLTFTNSYSKF